jgi:hypothetical protein
MNIAPINKHFNCFAIFTIYLLSLSCSEQNTASNIIGFDLPEERYSVVFQSREDQIYLIHDGEAEARALALRLNLHKVSHSPNGPKPVKIANKSIIAMYYSRPDQYMRLVTIGMLSESDWVLCIQRY